LNELLLILRRDIPDLPKDSRTLLKLSRKVDTEEIPGGQFAYFGFRANFERIVNDEEGIGDLLLLQINIDGVAIASFSKKQFWPILCQVNNKFIFLIGIFYGNSKPNYLVSCVDRFLKDFEYFENE